LVDIGYAWSYKLLYGDSKNFEHIPCDPDGIGLYGCSGDGEGEQVGIQNVLQRPLPDGHACKGFYGWASRGPWQGNDLVLQGSLSGRNGGKGSFCQGHRFETFRRV